MLGLLPLDAPRAPRVTSWHPAISMAARLVFSPTVAGIRYDLMIRSTGAARPASRQHALNQAITRVPRIGTLPANRATRRQLQAPLSRRSRSRAAGHAGAMGSRSDDRRRTQPNAASGFGVLRCPVAADG